MPRKKGKQEEIIDRRRKVWELRKAGYTHRAIATSLAAMDPPIVVDRKTVGNDIQAVSEELMGEAQDWAGEWRAINLARLENVMQVYWQKMLQGNDKPTDRVLQAIEAQRKLLGLDAPQKIAPTNPEGTEEYAGLTEQERAERIVALLERARARRSNKASSASAKSDVGAGAPAAGSDRVAGV